MFILSLCGISFALDPMGPTTSELKQGEKALGLEYAWSEMDIKVDFPSFADNLNKTLEIDNLHKIYAKFVWGISDDFDAFIRLGAAGGDNSFKINDPGSQVGRRDGGTDWGFAWGAGIKATLFKSSEELEWGLLAQYSSTKLDGGLTGKGDVVGRFKSYRIDLDEIQVAVGPTWTVNDMVTLYGGGLLHKVGGKYQVTNQSGDRNAHAFDDNINFGGYLGGKFVLGGDTTAVVEYTLTEDAQAVGLGLSWNF